MYGLSVHLKYGWQRLVTKMVPKEHWKNAKLIGGIVLDVICILFVSTVVATYFDLV